jgi:hypothetical protein
MWELLLHQWHPQHLELSALAAYHAAYRAVLQAVSVHTTLHIACSSSIMLNLYQQHTAAAGALLQGSNNSVLTSSMWELLLHQWPQVRRDFKHVAQW